MELLIWQQNEKIENPSENNNKKMRTTVIILMSLFVLTACNNSKKNPSKKDNQQSKTEESTSVGGEKDKHGCLTSAGETWSQLEQDCVQIFKVGKRLNPVKTKEGEAVISAFVLFNGDKSEVELFLPNTESNLILKAVDKETYENGKYKFDTNDSSLYINDTKTYRAQKAK